MAAPKLVLQSVSQVYHSGPHNGAGQIPALQDVSFHVADGEFVSVIGPSGCGKSTLLKLISGLLRPTRGEIVLDGRAVQGPQAGTIAMVFQDPLLLPWRTVTQNVAYGLELRRAPHAERQDVARRMLEMVGLGEFLQNYPDQLSGGMQQRVAIARALAVGPKVLLMDEPFGALDEQLRMVLGDELLRLWSQQRLTILFVTHSLSEAVYLSDRIVVLSGRPGRVKDLIASPLPRPRQIEMMGTQAFLEARNRLWHLLADEVRRVR
jgi:NitT/TauT family transport system ATP-binding protein